jgi:HSP20 family protein
LIITNSSQDHKDRSHTLEAIIMSITPWRWNNQISLLRDEMNRLFEGLSPSSGSSSESFPLIPNVDVSEDDDNFMVTAELPGVKREDIEVTVRGDLLEIRGHKREEQTEQTKHSYVHERSYGSFLRRISLPSEVDSEQCEAKMNNGVLELRLPKAGGNEGAKQIPIH